MFYLPYHYLCHLLKRLEDLKQHCVPSSPLIFVRETQHIPADHDFVICLSGTFSPSESIGPCLPCAKCPSSVPTLASCSATQDTQCECDVGFFFLSNHGLCAPCSTCSRGEGVIRECGPQGNTQCQMCGPGTFSEELRSTKPCQTCTQCSDSEVEIRACMPNSDTLCMGELKERIRVRKYTGFVKDSHILYLSYCQQVPRKDTKQQ